MNFRLTKPCGHCPFRKDIDPYLRTKRAEEISEDLLSDKSFTCHKTDRGLSVNMRKKMLEHCAGAMIMLEKIEKPNQAMRTAERLGIYDHEKLEMDSPVFSTLDEFIKAQEQK